MITLQLQTNIWETLWWTQVLELNMYRFAVCYVSNEQCNFDKNQNENKYHLITGLF